MMPAIRAKASGKTAFVNVRLLDPATGLDQIGGLLIQDGVINDLGPSVTRETVPAACPGSG